MSKQTTTLIGIARGMETLDRALQFGRSVDHPGVITASHTAAWHMAGMIEQLHSLNDDHLKELRQ